MAGLEINLRHFLALAEIAKVGRLSGAAENVYLSQSALTQALRKVERQLGAQLFVRAGFGVTTTPSGVLMVRRALRARDYLQRAEREIGARQRTVGGRLRLSQSVTTSQLRALVSVVETGGYSLAARQLGLAQPTVHRAARELEDLAGVPLFERATRGVEPTDTARVLARYGELIFAEIRQGLEEIQELDGRLRSRVAVGCLPLARAEFLPAAVTRLLARYPEARVSILDGPYDEQLHALRYGQIDWLIGALREPSPSRDIVQKPLFSQPLAVVVRPGHPLLASGAPPTAHELASLAWIAPQPLSPARRMFTEFLRHHGMEMPASIIECGSLIATCRLVEQSDRAALLSPLQIRRYVETGQLAVLVEALPHTQRSIGVTVRNDWVPTRIQAEFGSVLEALARQVGKQALHAPARVGN